MGNQGLVMASNQNLISPKRPTNNKGNEMESLEISDFEVDRRKKLQALAEKLLSDLGIFEIDEDENYHTILILNKAKT